MLFAPARRSLPSRGPARPRPSAAVARLDALGAPARGKRANTFRHRRLHRSIETLGACIMLATFVAMTLLV